MMAYVKNSDSKLNSVGTKSMYIYIDGPMHKTPALQGQRMSDVRNLTFVSREVFSNGMNP